MEALAPPAPTMAVRLSPAADPRPLPYPIAQATVTLAPTEGFRLVVEALPPGKYRVLLHNASRKTPSRAGRGPPPTTLKLFNLRLPHVSLHTICPREMWRKNPKICCQLRIWVLDHISRMHSA